MGRSQSRSASRYGSRTKIKPGLHQSNTTASKPPVPKSPARSRPALPKIEHSNSPKPEPGSRQTPNYKETNQEIRRSIKIKERGRTSVTPPVKRQPARTPTLTPTKPAVAKLRTPTKQPMRTSKPAVKVDKAARMNAARALVAFLDNWSTKVQHRHSQQGFKTLSAVAKKLKVKDQFAQEFRVYWLLNLGLRKIKQNLANNAILKKGLRRINIIVSGRVRETFREGFERIRREYAATSIANYISGGGGATSARSQGLSPAFKPQTTRPLHLQKRTAKHSFITSNEDEDSLPSGKNLRR